MRIGLLVNALSRRGDEWFDQALAEFARRDVEVAERCLARKPGQLLVEARRMADLDLDAVAIGGGDGTFSAVARAFVGREAPLGVLPFGTGNAFARDLGIPSDAERACEIVATGTPRRVDLGHANDDYFVNIATIGFSTHVAKNLDRALKRRIGRLAYLVALYRALRRLKPFSVSIEAEEGRAEFDCLQLVLANGRYHAGPFVVSPSAQIDEGRLSLYAVRSGPKSNLLRVAIAFSVGRHTDLATVYNLETAQGRVETSPTQEITVDGEICFVTPLKYGVAPKAIAVLCKY